MLDRSIFAYTAPGSDYPDYLSINRKDEQIEIEVRANHGGHLAKMVLPQEQLDKLIYALRTARINPLVGSARRYFISQYTDGPATRWNVIDRQTQEWVRRFPTEEAAQEYADELNAA